MAHGAMSEDTMESAVSCARVKVHSCSTPSPAGIKHTGTERKRWEARYEHSEGLLL